MQTQTTSKPVIVHCPCCRYGCTAVTCDAAYQAILEHIAAKHAQPMSGRVQ